MPLPEDDWKFRPSPGLASRMVSPPPWHLSGSVTCADFQCDPAAIAGFFPAEVEPDDAGRVSLVFADWVSASDADPRVGQDPARGQHREAYLVVYGRHRGRRVGCVPAIWVDNDLSLVRGLIQGFPKKLAQIHMTKEVTIGRAGSRRAAGELFIGHCSMLGARLARLGVTLERPTDEIPVAVSTPLLHTRRWPSVDGGPPAVNELTRGRIDGFEVADAYTGSAEVDLYVHDYEEIERFKPLSVGTGYVCSVAFSVIGASSYPIDG